MKTSSCNLCVEGLFDNMIDFIGAKIFSYQTVTSTQTHVRTVRSLRAAKEEATKLSLAYDLQYVLIAMSSAPRVVLMLVIVDGEFENLATKDPRILRFQGGVLPRSVTHVVSVRLFL
jgi:hypothetical protein